MPWHQPRSHQPTSQLASKHQTASPTEAPTCISPSRPEEHGLIIDQATAKDGNTTSFGYDAAGNLTSVTPPAPIGATRYRYDAFDRNVLVTDDNQEDTSLIDLRAVPRIRRGPSRRRWVKALKK
jgi:uncharacterized protein RhaS with RHS repeats